MIWAKEETLPRDEIEKIQLERLKETVSYIYERVEPYRRKICSREKGSGSFSCKFRNNRKADGCRVYEEGP